MRVPRLLTRAMLRPLRVLPVTTCVPLDTYSPEYLYLAQQSKRVSLVGTLNRFRMGNVHLWPLLLSIVFVKWLDLVLANALIRSLINEYDLLHRVDTQNIEKQH